MYFLGMLSLRRSPSLRSLGKQIAEELQSQWDQVGTRILVQQNIFRLCTKFGRDRADRDWKGSQASWSDTFFSSPGSLNIVKVQLLCRPHSRNGFPRLRGLASRPSSGGRFYILCFGFTMVNLLVVSPAHCPAMNVWTQITQSLLSRTFGLVCTC